MTFELIQVRLEECSPSCIAASIMGGAFMGGAIMGGAIMLSPHPQPATSDFQS